MERRLRSIIESFKYAFYGIFVAFRDERSMQIHGVMTLLVVIAMIVLKVNEAEILVLILNIGLVWVAELVNTALEESFDLQTQATHPQVKIGKDVAAGAVLVASLVAMLSGCIIFIPKLGGLLH